MKNKHIPNLLSVVPIKIRIEVYKEVLHSLEKEGNYKKTSGLCLVMPKCLWGLTTVHDCTPDGTYWDYFETITAFPELTKRIVSIITRNEDRTAIRIKYLKKWIQKLENK